VLPLFGSTWPGRSVQSAHYDAGDPHAGSPPRPFEQELATQLNSASEIAVDRVSDLRYFGKWSKRRARHHGGTPPRDGHLDTETAYRLGMASSHQHGDVYGKFTRRCVVMTEGHNQKNLSAD
jgi:hypothetical protein